MPWNKNFYLRAIFTLSTHPALKIGFRDINVMRLFIKRSVMMRTGCTAWSSFGLKDVLGGTNLLSNYLWHLPESFMYESLTRIRILIQYRPCPQTGNRYQSLPTRTSFFVLTVKLTDLLLGYCALIQFSGPFQWYKWSFFPSSDTMLLSDVYY